jgi:RNA polymerase-binding transcription factor DksA
MSSHSRLRAQLEERLADIRQRVGRIEADLRRQHDPDWAEQATELENDEVLEGLDDLGRAEVEAIRDALHRIENGTYGFCVDCHEAIDEKRLQAAPTASACILCVK